VDADLSGLSENELLHRMARHLKARATYAVGSVLWASAVVGYETAKREFERRVTEAITDAAPEQDDEP
jgi:hypothetical protein